MKKILIIGSGWYGCHLGYVLSSKGHLVTIFEKEKDIFLGSSGFNQFRLHNGFHYPRSSETILDVKKNFLRFIKFYKNFIKFVPNNIYCIAKENSLIDFGTYENILKSNKIPFRKQRYKHIKNIDGSVISNEGVILNKKIKKFYKSKLKKLIYYKKYIKNISNVSKKYDLVIDCTNNTLRNNFKNKIDYILTISHIYKSKSKTVYPLTVMDGELPSLYPFSDYKNLFTLTHSNYTHIKKFRNFKKLLDFKKKLKPSYLKKNKLNCERSIENYYCDFKKKFSYKGYFLSYKSLPRNLSSKRGVYFFQNKNVLSIFSPKISNIFTAQDYVERLVNEKKD